LQQGDLLLAKRIHFEAPERDRADAFTFAQQGHAQDGTVTLSARQFLCFGEIVALA
jgi:hypothetical protein